MKQQSSYTVQPRAWSWWRHQMETFSALLAICTGNSPVPGDFPAQRPVTRSFNVFFDLRPNKRLSKQSWGWWFATQCFPWWRHRNLFAVFHPCFGMCRWYRCSTSIYYHGAIEQFHDFKKKTTTENIYMFCRLRHDPVWYIYIFFISHIYIHKEIYGCGIEFIRWWLSFTGHDSSN